MRIRGSLDFSVEFKILNLVLFEGELSYKQLKKNNLDIKDTIDLLNLGYLSIIGKREFPYCRYKITPEGIKYMDDVSKFINEYPPKKSQSEI